MKKNKADYFWFVFKCITVVMWAICMFYAIAMAIIK
jgi:hypothetical protein